MVSVDQFKKAFAGKATPDVVSQRDQQVTAALKSYKKAVDGAAASPQTHEHKVLLSGLVQRFDKVKTSTAPGNERLAELDDILQRANSGAQEVALSPADSAPIMFPPPPTTAAPQQLPVVVNPFPWDIRPSVGEVIAKEKQAALEKRAYDLGHADGLAGHTRNLGTMPDWKEVKEDATDTVLRSLHAFYMKGFNDAVPKRQNELVTAHNVFKKTGTLPKTKYPYFWIEIKEGRMMNREERLAAMLKAQGKSAPTMGADLEREVDQRYMAVQEYREAVMQKRGAENTRLTLQEKDTPRSPKKYVAPEPGTGGSRNDDSSITFDGSASLSVDGLKRSQLSLGEKGNLEINAGESGVISCWIRITGVQDNEDDDGHFTHDIEGTWDVSADKKGALSITSTRFSDGNGTANDTTYRVEAAANDKVDGSHGIVVMQVRVVGSTTGTSSSEGSSTSVGFEWGGEVGGDVGPIKLGGSGKTSVGGSKSREQGKSQQVGAVSRNEKFTIKINVVNIIKEPPPPKPTAPKPTIVNAEYVIGPFAIGKDKDLVGDPFNPGSAKHLKATSLEKAAYDLMSLLPESTRDSLLYRPVKGEEKPVVDMIVIADGYASNQGTEKDNYDLANRRIAAVVSALKGASFPVSVLKEGRARGEWETFDNKGMEPTDDKKREKDSANFRKVVIKMKYSVTK